MIGWALLGAVLVWMLCVLAWDEWRNGVVAGWCWRCGDLLHITAFNARVRCPSGGFHDLGSDVTRQELRHISL